MERSFLFYGMKNAVTIFFLNIKLLLKKYKDLKRFFLSLRKAFKGIYRIESVTFRAFLCWLAVLTPGKSLPFTFPKLQGQLSLAKLRLLKTLILFKSVAAAASPKGSEGPSYKLNFRAALKDLFHKRVSSVNLQDSQSYLELWPVHYGLPTACVSSSKATLTGPFSFCKRGNTSGTWWGLVRLSGSPWVRS